MWPSGRSSSISNNADIRSGVKILARRGEGQMTKERSDGHSRGGKNTARRIGPHRRDLPSKKVS